MRVGTSYVKRVQEIMMDETSVKVGSFEACIWVAVEPIHRYVLGILLSVHQNTVIAQLFLKTLVEKYGKHPSTLIEEVTYPEACRALDLEHRPHPPYEKTIVGGSKNTSRQD
jgi:putative transposase